MIISYKDIYIMNNRGNQITDIDKKLEELNE